MNDTEKQKLARYVSLSTKKWLQVKTSDESLTPEEEAELRSILEELGGDHKDILKRAKNVLFEFVENNPDESPHSD